MQPVTAIAPFSKKIFIKKGRFEEIDYIKGISAIAVIILHTIPKDLLAKPWD
jgi:hypothetical protein